MNAPLKKSLLISPFLIFFVIHSLQVGIGVLSFTKSIAEDAGYHAWIAVPLAGLLCSLLIWILYFVLNDQQSDVVDINRTCFGKYIGGFVTLLILSYFLLLAVLSLRVYIQIVQLWVFIDIPTWPLSITILIVAYYAISQGFRVNVGLSFFSVMIPIVLLFITFFFSYEYAKYTYLLPLLDTTIMQQFAAIKTMSLSFFGPSILLVCYPFIQEAKKSQKYAHLANGFTTILYIITTLITFTFFSEGQLEMLKFPTLVLWQIISFPFLERFEFVAIALWLIVILPKVTLLIWAASRMFKRQFNIKQRKALLIFIAIAFLLSLFFETRVRINAFSTFISNIGLYYNFVYIPLLFVIILIKRKMSR
ncbi:GerAB/ArcD/ProY family transporter [bacterium LRH843]|nr:GerAB/ArcD/ProY family transporter [bacterium LRH843]